MVLKGEIRVTLGAVGRRIGKDYSTHRLPRAARGRREGSKKETNMAEVKDKSIDQNIEGATHPVAAKSGELSDAELQAVAGGEIDDFSFDVEQTLNIGSQSTGSGAGKVAFGK